MIIINLISGPRNISTALMYSFAQRPDTTVLDEPFYAVYLSKTSADHPGKNEVLSSQSSAENEVVSQIFSSDSKPVLFLKNMAHHIEVLDKQFLKRVTNVFLIRNPVQIISSYAEVIKKPVMRDIGIEYQFKLFSELQEKDETPIIIDSGDILRDPRSVLSQLCEKIAIDYTDEMLRWPAGPKPYDGIWAPYWYENVHKSTGFERQPTSSRKLPETLKPLCDEANSYYEKLAAFALKPQSNSIR